MRRMRSQHSKPGEPQPPLTSEDLENAFAETQARRAPRTTKMMRMGNLAQKIFAYENSIFSQVAFRMMRMGGLEGTLRSISEPYADAPRLEALAVPKRPHALPFTDELPVTPITCTTASRGVMAFTMGVLGILAHSCMCLCERGARSLEMEMATASERDRLATYDISMMYLSTFLPPALIWPLDANRLGSTAAPLLMFVTDLTPADKHGIYGLACTDLYRTITFSLIWSLLGGSSSVLSVYFLFSVLFGDNSIAGRAMLRDVAATLLPAVSAAAILHIAISSSLPSFTKWWQCQQQIYGVLLVYSIVLLTRLQKLRESRSAAPENAALRSLERYDKKDLAPLNICYGFVFTVCSTIYAATTIDGLRLSYSHLARFEGYFRPR